MRTSRLVDEQKMSMLDDEKRFYDRFWALHGDPMLVRIFAEFGPEPFRRSSVLEGFEPLILALARMGGRCAVEIGTWKGLSALVLSRHFKQVVSIDIEPDPDRKRVAAFAGVTNVRFETVADNAAKARLIEGLDFDFAYLDGDHAHDTETDFELARRCRQVLFHEYWPAQPAVVALVDRLAADDNSEVMTHGKFALWMS